MSETEQILKAIEDLRNDLSHLRTDLSAEVIRWDERFFQLSQDTLIFTCNVITTAAVVAVLTPILIKVLDSPVIVKLPDKLLIANSCS
jgi:hypothetical protein